MPPISTRRVTVADLNVIVADVQAGFDSYVDFAPLGWVPPDVFADTAGMAELLADLDTWALLAVAASDPVGHIAFTPARARTPGQPWASSPTTPGLAHLWQLFVLPEWWGRGVAPRLHEAAIEAMRARGYSAVRLYTPSLHARARRFYERHGWVWTGEHWNDRLTLMLAEYQLGLGP
ncbi:MAG: GNAT family N-acetyltransferase [Actinomycetota bacterium]|nr:GNAT family N-acetyltransferase [Actinomycetota bacterium]